MMFLMRFRISGHSMEPNFKEGRTVLVSSLPYLFRLPKIGDVAVVKDPRSGRLLLKRIVRCHLMTYRVAGDNPQASTDSRTFGAVKRENILGKVIFIGNS